MFQQFISFFTVIAFMDIAVIAAPVQSAARSKRTAGQIHLDDPPICSPYWSPMYGNCNHGVNMGSMTTILGFADSWTATGNSVGGEASPAVASGTYPYYGGRFSNGPMWIEDLAEAHNATLKNYAIAGAVTDTLLWPSLSTRSSMPAQVDTFLAQNQVLDGSQTVAAIFYGINDYSAWANNGDPNNFPAAAASVLNQTQRLVSYGIQNFLILGVPFKNATTQDYQTRMWQGFKEFAEAQSIRFAYVDIAPLIVGSELSPTRYGYTNGGVVWCLMTLPTEGVRIQVSCFFPEKHGRELMLDERIDDYVHWLPDHPQYQTHENIFRWSNYVLDNCKG